MNTSKCRAWHKTQKVMGYPYGIILERHVYLFLSGGIQTWLLSDIELMWWSGLTDKSGKHVYEGDIVKAVLKEFDASAHEVIEVVEIYEGLLAPFYMRVNCEEDWWKDCLVDGFEVIGNIYEHPHLLHPQEQTE